MWEGMKHNIEISNVRRPLVAHHDSLTSSREIVQSQVHGLAETGSDEIAPARQTP
jgi:hypothetical protein